MDNEKITRILVKSGNYYNFKGKEEIYELCKLVSKETQKELLDTLYDEDIIDMNIRISQYKKRGLTYN